MLLTRQHMQTIVNAKAHVPWSQRTFLQTVRVMLEWAVGEGRVPDNPALGVKRRKVKTDGYKTASEAHIKRIEARWPIGSKERLAFALILYTGQRRSDVVKMGPVHVHRGILTVDQKKTEGGEEAHLEIPMHPKLKAIIEATPTVGLKTFLVTFFGNAYTSPGFGNWSRDICNAAGCHDVSAHSFPQGDRATSRRDQLQRTSDRGDPRPCLAQGSRALHEGRQPQAPRARSDGEAGRGWMVNRYCPTLRSGWTRIGEKP
jgi:integrase